MKKLIAILVVLTLCLSLVACGGTNTKLESETLELLNDAYSYCNMGMYYMLRAWDFSIEHSSDNTLEEYEALWSEFGKHMSLTEDEMVEALIGGCGMTIEDLSLFGDDNETKDPSKGLNTLADGMLFMKASFAVNAAKYAFQQRMKDMDIDAVVEQIKGNLKQIGEDSKAYDIYKEYYLMVCEMKQWIESPDGSYNSSSDNYIDYEKKVETYRQELDLIID